MSTRVEFARPEVMHPTRGYSHYGKFGRIVWIAGQVSLDAQGVPVGVGDFKAQLEQVFANLDTAVREAGGSFHDVVKLNYFCVADVPSSELAHVAPIRDRYANVEAPPISTFVFVTRLVRPEWLVEVEAVAVIGPPAG